MLGGRLSSIVRAQRARTRRHAAWTAALLLISLSLPTAANTPTVPSATAAQLEWRLPASPPMPPDNPGTPARIQLGKALFFDPRLSGSGTTSCASCHNPALGWSDGLKTAVGVGGQVLARATPTVVNTAFNTQFMWDGRKKSLEDQALGPMKARDEMDTDFATLFERLRGLPAYVALFDEAYPREGITEETIAKALATFERTLVSSDSPFDRWLAGDAQALTPAQWRGFQVFANPDKGNCAACHNGPNFTDNGFHNIGIAASGKPDPGRFGVRPVASMKGAFKTPTLRDIELTAPYFRDGSAATLREVVDHYVRGGDDRSNLSTNMKPLHLSEQEKEDLVAFLRSLTGQRTAFVMPELPR
ncbi:cytochrome c peroxidase [Ramlibacter sp.]|uniref:cytochrome-c peroxidase n=1 Tax=Ramlibacter sp. TaxID=1917967 RepID=UPI00261A9EC4|nr:cytochrome c peroxidase [Ramlibacter sp.]MDB5954302.1 cpx [Ramlibacter sp.]